jgi:hypothetical protein
MNRSKKRASCRDGRFYIKICIFVPIRIQSFFAGG